MKIIDSYKEFNRLTDPLMFEDFSIQDITPDFQIGVFFPTRLPELIAYCNQNPDYHIISYLKSNQIQINKIVENAAFYRLGKGDCDPELTYIMKINSQAIWDLQILKFDID